MTLSLNVFQRILVSLRAWLLTPTQRKHQPTRSKTIVRPKIEMPGKALKKQRLDDKQVAGNSQAEEISARA